jgi:hypothetical protein
MAARMGRPVWKLLLPFLLCFIFAAFAGTAKQVYNYQLKAIDGKPTLLAKCKGKVPFVVNVASSCGCTPRYSALEALYESTKIRDSW